MPIIHTRASVRGRNAVSKNRKHKMEDMERNLKTVEDEIIHYFNNDFYGDLPAIFELINHPYNYKIKITDLIDYKIKRVTHINDVISNPVIIELVLIIDSYDVPYNHSFGVSSNYMIDNFIIKNKNEIRIFIQNIKEFPQDKVSFDKNKLQKLLLTMK